MYIFFLIPFLASERLRSAVRETEFFGIQASEFTKNYLRFIEITK